MSILSKVPRRYRLWAKARLFELRRLLARSLLSYDGPQLIACIRKLGVQPGDTVLLHSSFEEHHGFRGTVQEVTDVFIDAVGPAGNLLMVSLPYRSSSLQYLSKLKRFDVRKTPSMMGMMSELFRRRPNVLRSLSPTHPMLVHGPKAQWFVAGHESCQHPCGPGSPFEKLVTCDAKAVFYNTSFDAYTFFHYLEHLVSSEMPFRLYTDTPFPAQVVDFDGVVSTVPTYAFAIDAMRRRRFAVLENELLRRHAIKKRRLGNGSLLVVSIRETVECVRDMTHRGVYFYDVSDLPPVHTRTGRIQADA
jgi:aminoglycoside 3-N-acetyltransferase